MWYGKSSLLIRNLGSGVVGLALGLTGYMTFSMEDGSSDSGGMHNTEHSA